MPANSVIGASNYIISGCDYIIAGTDFIITGTDFRIVAGRTGNRRLVKSYFSVVVLTFLRFNAMVVQKLISLCTYTCLLTKGN